jgi:hypothetical protein
VELGKPAEAAGLRKIFETALADLRASLKTGCIEEEGFRWIPNSPGKPAGTAGRHSRRILMGRRSRGGLQ